MQRLEQSGALDRAGPWLQQEIQTLNLSYATISQLFERAWDSITAWDLFDPAAAWGRLAGIFGPPIDRVIAFAERAAEKLLEFALEAMLAAGGGAAEQIMGILRRAGEAFGAIARDPLGFARNLIRAVVGGFEKFLENIGTHLQRGLIGWLTGALQGVIRLPQRLDFEGIVSLVTQILDLTWERVRERLVRLIGPRRVAFLERTVDFVRAIADRGLGAAWEKIMEFASGLADQVFEAIRNWIAESVIGAALRRLATMFNPVGALINAVIAIYDTIQFVIERARQIGDLVDAVSSAISEIASGAIGRAVDAVEAALGRAVPVAISFLAELIGLDNVGDRVRQIIDRARETIDNAIDSVIEWIKSRFSGESEEEGEAAGAEGEAQPEGEAREEFEMEGSEHTLFLSDEAEPVLEMASATRESILVKLDREIEVATTPEQQNKARRLRDVASALLTRLRAQTADAPGASSPEGQRRLATLTNRLDELRAQIVAYAREYRRTDLGGPSAASPQEDAAMVTEARAQLRIAKSALEALPPHEQEEKTYAAGGGLTRLSGWGANRPPEGGTAAEGQRYLEHRGGLHEESGRITRAIWNATVTYTNERTGEVRRRGALPGTGSAEEIEQAFDTWISLDAGPIEGPEPEPAAEDGPEFIRPVSGGVSGRTAEQQMRDLLERGATTARVRMDGAIWRREIRVAPDPAPGQIAGVHVPRGNQSDMSVPGQYSISHAEQQVRRAAGDAPIGVSRDMCEDCQNYFRSQAASANRTLVVADPSVVRLFRPDGQVDTG
jgi:hypothetical protein